MAMQLITIGTPGAGGGDPAHAAFKKINDNTNEVYSFFGADGSGNLTPEGARGALNTYPKDEVYSKGEVYSKEEVENLVENSGFASLETNTFTGHQTMNAGATVIGDLLLNGLNLGTAFSGGNDPANTAFHFTIPRKEDPSRPWIIQIGTQVLTVSAGATNTYTLPVAYPTIEPMALVTTGDLRASGGHIIGLNYATKSQIIWSCTGTTHVRMNYIAVGY